MSLAILPNFNDVLEPANDNMQIVDINKINKVWLLESNLDMTD